MERHQKRNRFYHTFLNNMPTITKECINSSEYYYEDGLRKVRYVLKKKLYIKMELSLIPYAENYNNNLKYFVHNRPYFTLYDAYLHDLKEPITLVDYFVSLLGEPFADYQNLRVKLGLVFVNMEKATSTNQILHEGDYVSSLIHYHERPVLDQKIKIIFEDDNILVVNKPASMVVHPRTGYRLNSLIYILAKEMGYMNLRPVHRLDKLTSGVIILAKVNECGMHIQVWAFIPDTSMIA